MDYQKNMPAQEGDFLYLYEEFDYKNPHGRKRFAGLVEKTDRGLLRLSGRTILRKRGILEADFSENPEEITLAPWINGKLIDLHPPRQVEYQFIKGSCSFIASQVGVADSDNFARLLDRIRKYKN